jgi:hypothetical protein
MAVSEAKKRANAKYNSKAYDRIELLVPKGMKSVLQAYAKNGGESLNGFIKRAVEEAMRRDPPPLAEAGGNAERAED